MTEFNFSEKDLDTDLNELASEIVRELFVAAKKVSVYSYSHPISGHAIGRLFAQMGKAYRFKKHINFHVDSGHLYVFNIELRPSVFSDLVVEFMQLLDIKSILFDSDISVKHLSIFLDKFVRRIPSGNYQDLMPAYLEKNRIDTIEIDSEKGFLLFEKGPKCQSDIEADYSIRNLLNLSLGEDLDLLAKMLFAKEGDVDIFIEKFFIDYYPSLVAYFIPEKISLIESEQLIELLNDWINKIAENDKDNSGNQNLNNLKILLDSLSLHPERDIIFNQIESNIAYNKISKEIYSEVVPKTSAIRVESSEKINEFLYVVFDPELLDYDLNLFEDLFRRLIRTGQKNRARSVINILVSHLAGPHFELRERALILLRTVLDTHQQSNADFLLDHSIEKIDNYVTDGLETFEFSDLLWAVAKRCLVVKDYARLSTLCDILLNKRGQTDGIRCFDSIAVKKSIEDMDRPEVIDQLLNELLREEKQNTGYLKNILLTIASDKVAYSLASIISHDSRQVRMNVLKILSEMGKPALRVCGEILKDEFNFQRSSSRRELPDDKWFIVRNAIFVIGSLGDTEGCQTLRFRIAEDDTRVRLAIVTALEKIGDESAVDLLLIMSDDNDHEIGQAAIIALGQTGQSDIAPELMKLAEKRKREVLTIISTLGKLRGVETKAFFTRLLDDSELLSKYTSNKSSRDDIKFAIIKALGRIGDTESIKTVENFQNFLSSPQKIFFGGSKINKAIEEILKNR